MLGAYQAGGQTFSAGDELAQVQYPTFRVEGDTLDFAIVPVGAAVDLHAVIDGQATPLLMSPVELNVHRVRLAGMGAGEHVVTLVVGSTGVFRGVRVAPAVAVAAPPPVPTIAVGPSNSWMSNGYGGVTAGFGFALARATGWIPRAGGQPGTGMLSGANGVNGSTPYTSPQRLAALAAAVDETTVAVLLGSPINDYIYVSPTPTPAQIGILARSLFATIGEATGLPLIPFGVEPIALGNVDLDAYNDAVREAAHDSPHVYRFVDWRGERWVDETNAAEYLWDGEQPPAHPGPLGNEHLGALAGLAITEA